MPELTHSRNVRPIVLVVDDNPADVNLIQEACDEEQIDCGFWVLEDGAGAIEQIEQWDADESRPCPDIVLLDLNLPKVSGEEVLKRARSSRRCHDVKILIVSSSNSPADRERVMRFGATDYFRKPSTLDQFMELGPRVRHLLQS
jgi:CheY-like chemotaxis protein